MQRHAGKTRESREASKVRAEAAEKKAAAGLQTREGKRANVEEQRMSPG